MAKVRLLGQSGYHININLKGVEIDAEQNSYGAWGVKRTDLEAIGLDEGTFDDSHVYFCSAAVEVLESD